MQITPYGRRSCAATIFAVLLLLVLVWFFFGQGIIAVAATVLAAVISLVVLNFYRDPERTAPAGNDLVIAPADGKIVLIKEVNEPTYLRQNGMQISIFMSPLDVHVNRIPVTGTVGHFEHIPGSYGAAFKDKSSDENERTCIGIQHGGCRVFFRQISGALARRIVADLAIGQPVTAGTRFGMIKLGSRVDVVLPKSAAVNVRLHDRVVAGETIIARLEPCDE